MDLCETPAVLALIFARLDRLAAPCADAGRQLVWTTSGCAALSVLRSRTAASRKGSDLPAVGAREAGKGLPLTEEKPRSQHVVDVR